MKKLLTRFLLLFLVFTVSVTVTALFFGSESTDDRQEMNDPVLPEVMMEYDGLLTNRMCGYRQQMQTDFMRDSITPLDTTRKLVFVVNPYQTTVTSLAYEIRTSDGAKVIENRKIKNLTADDSKYLRAETEISSDLRLNQEYSLQITLETNQQEAYYYTRVVARSNLNTGSYIRFVRTFVEKSLDKQNANDLMDYMEPEVNNAATNYSAINIHSSLNELSWGSLGAQMYRRGIPVIREINETTASVSVDYQISARDDHNNLEIYDVTEFYRMRYTAARIRLLDFKRSAAQVFGPTDESISENGLYLGVRDRNVDALTNTEAGITAFVQESDLWSFSSRDGKTTRIFSFRRNEGGDFRDARGDHDIRIIRIYDNADIDFVVYGYMNRGGREGYLGLCVYHYDNDRNVVEERVFIPVTESYEFLRRDMGKCAYVSTQGHLYLLFSGSLYQVNIQEGSFSVLESGIDDTAFAASFTGAHAAWLLTGGEDAGKIREIDFETLATRLIAPDEERQLRLIGFMNEDLIYGILREKDILEDANGHIREGIKALCFETFDGELLKKYNPGKQLFITKTELGSSLLEFDVSRKNGTAYETVRKDNILNNSRSTAGQVSVELVNSSRCGVRVRLAYTGSIQAVAPLVMYAKHRGVDDRVVRLAPATTREDVYYVYAGGHLDSILEDPAQAVIRADEMVGVVLNSRQQYIWERGNKKTNAMLNLDDIPQAMKTGRLDFGELKEGLPAESELLDLTGCSLDNVLYEISSGRPVLAGTGNGKCVLIVGYDTYNTWLYDPATGEVKPYGMQDSTALFEKAGNIFVTFLEKVQL